MALDEQKILITFSTDDNVAIALSDLTPGESYPLISGDGGSLGQLAIALRQPAWYSIRDKDGPVIRRYYKVATTRIAKNDPIVKDREAIGVAADDVLPGQIVHQVFRSGPDGFERVGGNIREHPSLFSAPARQLEALAQAARITHDGLNRPSQLRARETSAGGARTVMAYDRIDGVFGSRNHLLVIPSVFCVNQEAGEIADSFRDDAWGDQGENRVIALPHTTGCCQVGYDEEVSLRLLANMIAHPNVGAALIVTLGCSPLCVQDRLFQTARFLTAKPIRSISIQALGRAAALTAGKAAAAGMLADLKSERRTPRPLDELLLAVKCGASDLTSGLFANTATGHIADFALDQGGSVVISEIMEFFGAEKALKGRCRDQAVWLSLLRIIKTNEMIGKASAVMAETEINSMELTMGNIEAGLSTQAEKSLGAVRKMGFRHPIENVVGFGERLAGARSGLYVMDGPGQDLISSSGLGAAGAQLMIFTTGIGNPLGNALTPVIKITGNRETASRQSDFIDIYVPLTELLQQGLSARDAACHSLWNEVIAALEGRLTRAEQNNHRDFASRSYAMVQ